MYISQRGTSFSSGTQTLQLNQLGRSRSPKMLSILLVYYNWRAVASQPSRTTGTIFLYKLIYIIGERERANLVVRLARFFYFYVAGVAHTVSVLNVFT